ncbi:MAG TPA: hypothetical protein VFF65_13920 [Phycisphaerales bacterium]|nr:hypothetical protein [Phycisphaerales bacterium]
MSREVYFSTDIESDGPIPGPHSMLSFAAAAIRGSGEVLGTYTANLELLPGAAPEPATAGFWAEHPDAFNATRVGTRPPGVVMLEFAAWVDSFPGKPVFAGYPVVFDFMFVHWYLHRFAGRTPFSHSALDMKTFAMVLLNLPYRSSTKRAMPRAWFPPRPHTHVALDDALEQGQMLVSMLAARRGMRSRCRPAGPGDPGRAGDGRAPEPTSTCCAQMGAQLAHRCPEHADRSDCPDALVTYSPGRRRYGLIVHDGGSSAIDIGFCPWCGADLCGGHSPQTGAQP